MKSRSMWKEWFRSITKTKCRLQRVILTAIFVLALLLCAGALYTSSRESLLNYEIVRVGMDFTTRDNQSVITKVIKEPGTDDAIVNPSQFNYIINEKHICSQRNIQLLIYVYTALDNLHFRRTIRKTWAYPAVASQLNYTVIFVMGKSHDVKLMAHIKHESVYHRDIIQEDYIDSYRNLSLKGLSALKWVTTYCSRVPLILKIDDDIVPNIYRIQQYLNDFGFLYTGKKIVFGLVNTGMWVERNKTSKLYIPEGKFSSNHFPAYCAGAAYLFTSVAAKAIYDVSFGVPYLHIEDVFITGILGKMAGVLRAQVYGEYEFRDSYFLALCTIHKKMPDAIWFALVSHPDMLQRVWRYGNPYVNNTNNVIPTI